MSDLRYDVGRAASPVCEFDEIVESEKNATPTDGIGLCLSGGGYRAMLFHVGAILRLNEARLLPKLCRVSSVSGGSITAAVLGMNWRKLCFAADTSAKLEEFRNMLDRILRGCCVGNATCNFSQRSAVLSQELLDMMAPGSGTAVDDETLVWNWVERNDARAYILLGDPAVRLQ